MSQMSDYLEGEIVKHGFRTGSWTKPTGLTIHLYTATPGETGGGTEVSGGSYAAQALNPLDANWNAVSGGNGATANTAQLNFPTPSANWGVVTSIAIKDNGSNYLMYGNLTASKTVNNGDPAPYFGASALAVTFA